MSEEQSNLGLTAEGLVMIGSEDCPEGTPVVRGPDFDDESICLDSLLASYATMGFQATNISKAINEINKMLNWRLSDEPIREDESEEYLDPEFRANHKCKIWLSMTSNVVSCGLREIIKYLAKHKLIDVIVTTAGAVEEDIMKCLRPHYIGDFNKQGKDLRMRGINRIGNLLVPNLNYVSFEDWVSPIFVDMHKEQVKNNKIWTPSEIIRKFGEVIDNEDSIWYWCAKNDIPVFCPGITDGAIGDMLYFHLWKHNGFIVDIAADVRKINDISVRTNKPGWKSGLIMLGGGLPKHHVCNANLMRNGADFSVNINTGVEYDGSDSGANPDEAVSWGKIKLTANPVKVNAEVSFVFPLIVSQTFVKYVRRGCVPEKKQEAAKEIAK